ncbi:hypothetical protein ACIGD1_03995 [Streptomyces sp. NPDC085612]|uniref:hypothetical protein n=1 Tax=Streptomyces sp. NPDC085612 TaxID=3365732 RepID=UPI0037CD68D0
MLTGLVLSLWNTPDTPAPGTEWFGYAETVLLLALPAWYRFLPAAGSARAGPPAGCTAGRSRCCASGYAPSSSGSPGWSRTPTPPPPRR